MNMGKLVILSGPSGVGKDTVIDRWKLADPRVTRVVAYTTREPRPGEVAGFDYHFVDRPTFKRMADGGHFLEWKQVYDNFYATPLTDMEALLESGKIAVLKIDVQGALSAMELREDAISIFLLPPDPDELLRRLQNRGTESGEVLLQRVQNARGEMDQADQYKYQVVNDDLDRTVEALQEILNG